ncbi:ATP-binding protein [Kitasatospora sp. NPDC059673]|uniref:ATP-binding protein n=1 Tax=Kitasatospora sp. NPDC059673 TaxID=3346901 RepID=UPI0036B562DA
MDVGKQELREQEWKFPATPDSVRLARRDVDRAVQGWGWEPDSSGVDDLVVIVSELVTNAVLHASVPRRDVLVRLRQIEDRCRVEVVDGRPDLLPTTVLQPSKESGRGLLLVRKLSADMGVKRAGGDKIVWAEVHHQGRLEAAA